MILATSKSSPLRVSSKHKKVDNPSYQFIKKGTKSKDKMLLLQGKLKEILAAESSEIKRSIKLKSELLLRLKLPEGIKYSPLGAEKIANLKEESWASENIVDDEGFYYYVPCSTEQDQSNIRNTLASLMAYSSGLIFTINIPLFDEKMHALKGSTPTLIIPDEWCKNIKANRTSNKKGKKATKVTSEANFDLYIEDPNLAVRK